MKIKYSYLDEQFRDCEGILGRIRQLLTTGEFTLGPAVTEFETRFAKICKTRFAIGVNSGTDALYLSLKALGVGAGDEVITAPNTFYATVAAIVLNGAKPVFVDVADDYLIDVAKIEAAITPKTKAILPVHLTGCPANMTEILRIAKKHRLFVVEDAAQAIGATINGQPVGSFGNTGCFSLHPLKNLNVWGDGGVIVSNDEKLVKRLRLLRNHGLEGRDLCVEYAYNSRLDSLQALVGIELMEKIDAINEQRRKNALSYDAALSKLNGWVQLPTRRKELTPVFHTYVMLAKHRDALYNYLLQEGVDAKIHYKIPLHLQPASRFLGHKKGDFPVCEQQAEAILTLPIHQHLTPEELNYVIEKVRGFYKNQ